MRRLWALGLGIVLLAGCDLAPHYKVPLVAVPASYQDTAIWHTATPADDHVSMNWWKAYNDPTLNMLEDKLNGQNYTLAAAAATYDQARANAAEVVAGLYPGVAAFGGINKVGYPNDKVLKGHGIPTDILFRNTLGGGLNYEVDFWDQIHNQIAAGVATAQAGAAELAFIRLSLEAELANDYLMLRGLDALVDLLAHTVVAYQQALGVAQNRFNGMISSGLDVSRAQAQVELARSEYEGYRARRALTEHAIATLISVPAPAFSIPPSLTPIALPRMPPSVPSVLLQRRPDISAAERQVAAANAVIGVARAAFYPNVQINAMAGFQNSSLAMLNLPSTFWAIGPSFNLPIFEGGFLRAQEAVAIAAFNNTAASYRNTVVTAFQEVEDALAQLHYYSLQEADDRREVAAAQRTLNMANALYKDGATNFLEVVVAQEELLTAQRQQLDQGIAYLQSGVRLVRALGGGWDERDLPAPGGTPIRHVAITQ